MKRNKTKVIFNYNVQIKKKKKFLNFWKKLKYITSSELMMKLKTDHENEIRYI